MNAEAKQTKRTSVRWIGWLAWAICVALLAVLFVWRHGEFSASDWRFLYVLIALVTGLAFFLVSPGSGPAGGSENSFKFKGIVSLGGAAAIGMAFMWMASQLVPDVQASDARILTLDSHLHLYGGADEGAQNGHIIREELRREFPEAEIYVEPVYPQWREYDLVRNCIRPNVVIIHYSAFAADVRDPDRDREAFEEVMANLVSEGAHERRFVVYSRQWAPGEEDEMKRAILGHERTPWPAASDVRCVPVGSGRSFRDRDVMDRLLRAISESLET